MWLLFVQMSVPRVTAKTSVSQRFLTFMAGARSNASVPSGNLSLRTPSCDYAPSHGNYEFAQRFRLKNDRPAILQFKNALALPCSQTAIDLLPRSAGHFRQFTLG